MKSKRKSKHKPPTNKKEQITVQDPPPPEDINREEELAPVEIVGEASLSPPDNGDVHKESKAAQTARMPGSTPPQWGVSEFIRAATLHYQNHEWFYLSGIWYCDGEALAGEGSVHEDQVVPKAVLKFKREFLDREDRFRKENEEELVQAVEEYEQDDYDQGEVDQENVDPYGQEDEMSPLVPKARSVIPPRSVVSVPPPRGKRRSYPSAVKPISMLPDGPQLPDDLAQIMAAQWVGTMESMQEVGAWKGDIPRSFRIKVGEDGSILMKAVPLPKDVVVVGDSSRYAPYRQQYKDVEYEVPEDSYYEEEFENDGVPRRTLIVGDDGDVDVRRR